MQWPALLENDEPMEVYSSLCYAPLNKRLASFEDKDMLERFFVNSIISQSTCVNSGIEFPLSQQCKILHYKTL